MSVDSARHLVIFVTSERPDPYVNSLSCVFHSSAVESVTFVSLAENSENNSAKAAALMTSVTKMIAELSTGEYPGDTPVSVAPEIANSYELLEKKLYRVSLSAVSWPRADLASCLRKVIHEHNQVIFDVTALRKDLLVEVGTILISLGHPKAFTFELTKSPSYDWRDLFYATGNRDCKYENLLAGTNVTKALKRTALRQLLPALGLAFLIFTVIIVIKAALPRSVYADWIFMLGGAVTIASFPITVWHSIRQTF